MQKDGNTADLEAQEQLLLRLQRDVLSEPDAHWVDQTGDGNFADHVMYYVNGMQRRGLRLNYISLREAANYSTVIFKMQTKDLLAGLDPETKIAARGWVKVRHASGMFEFAEYKQGRDELAYNMALFIVTHVELLNFQPDVVHNPDHEQNKYPLIDGLRRNGAFILLKTALEGMIGVLRHTTKNIRSLAAAARMRDSMLHSDEMNITCQVLNVSTGQYVSTITLRQDLQVAARDMFLRDLSNSEYMTHSDGKLLAMGMGLHHRTGAESLVRHISGDVLSMIVEMFKAARINQFETLLRPGA